MSQNYFLRHETKYSKPLRKPFLQSVWVAEVKIRIKQGEKTDLTFNTCHRVTARSHCASISSLHGLRTSDTSNSKGQIWLASFNPNKNNIETACSTDYENIFTLTSRAPHVPLCRACGLTSHRAKMLLKMDTAFEMSHV